MVTTGHRPRRGWVRPLTSVATGAALLVSGVVGTAAQPAQAAPPKLPSTAYGNLAEALQKSLYFYDAEKSGPSRSLGRQPLEWRGDSEPIDAHIPLTANAKDSKSVVTEGTNLPADFIAKNKAVLDPDGDGTVDLSMGFHDAGDHVKFGLPQGYAASTLAWGAYEFKDAYVKTGTYAHLMDNLYWFTDYFLKSTFRDKDGKVIAFAYQVGNGDADHTYWGPSELQTIPRGAMFAYTGAGASDQVAQAAASLTAMSLLTKDSDPAYSKKCLETGVALYTFAVTNRGLGASGGYYGSAYDDDELAWAASWLWLATGTQSYLDDIVAKNPDGTYKGYLKRIISSVGSTWQNIWVHSWDVVWGGTFALLAPATKGKVDDQLNKDLWFYFRWNIEYWSGGSVPHVGNISGDSYMAASPAGYSVVATWGSARYNTAAQLCALVYRKHAAEDPAATAAHGDDLAKWALSQMNYIMGDNPLHRSYIVGFTAKDTDTYALHPHHRDAHGSATLSMLDPPLHKHVLWGALVGGPDEKDEHNDVTTDYVYNEVAIDYNAAFVGALAGLWTYFGQSQTVTPWTPPLEPAERAYYSRAKLEQENKARTQLTIEVNNRVTHPPALVDDLSARYYVDLTELVAAGQTVDDVVTEVYYDEAKTISGQDATISRPIKYGTTGNLYYVEVSWKGIDFWGKREFQFGLISKQDKDFLDHWNPTNDYSRKDLPTGALGDTPRVTTYRNGVLVDGTEPDGTTPKPSGSVTTTTTKTSSTTSTTTTRKSSTKKSSTKKSSCKGKTCTTKKPSCKGKTCTTKKSSKKKAASAACTADVRMVSAWSGGFQATVTVTAGASGSDWTLRWSAPGSTLTQVAGAALTPTSGGAVLSGVGSTDLLQPGRSTTVTVVGTSSGALAPQVACS
ncbi:MAG: glycoside hydrolase family 9 protein [Kineosporiaceae bacterium]